MPLVTVNLWEELLDTETETKVISRFTDAFVDVLGEQVRPYVVVLVNGVPQCRWGTAGVPASVAAPVDRPVSGDRGKS